MYLFLIFRYSNIYLDWTKGYLCWVNVELLHKHLFVVNKMLLTLTKSLLTIYYVKVSVQHTTPTRFHRGPLLIKNIYLRIWAVLPALVCPFALPVTCRNDKTQGKCSWGELQGQTSSPFRPFRSTAQAVDSFPTASWTQPGGISPKRCLFQNLIKNTYGRRHKVTLITLFKIMPFICEVVKSRESSKTYQTKMKVEQTASGIWSSMANTT